MSFRMKGAIPFMGCGARRGTVSRHSNISYIYDNLPSIYSITTDSGSGSAPCNTLSPNSAWRTIYRGVNPADAADTGQFGVRVPSALPDPSIPRVNYAYAYNNTSTANDTDAHLTLSEKSFGDFDASIWMRTIAQKKTTFVKEWETAWFMWHFNQAAQAITAVGAHYHHYYVVLKTSGKLEMGRKDIPLALEPSDYQYFIDSSTGSYGNEPTFTWNLGQWYGLRIKCVAEGANVNHIQVWLDGTLKVDAVDDGTWGTPNTVTNPDGAPPHAPSTFMSSGKFGVYAEDAEAEWGPLSIIEL